MRDYFQVLKIAKQHLYPFIFLILYPIYGHIKKTKKDGVVVAFAIYSFGKLHYFAVDRKVHRMGVGRELLERVKHKFYFLRVEYHNRWSYLFFKNAGFVKFRVRNTIFGKRIVMRHAPK